MILSPILPLLASLVLLCGSLAAQNGLDGQDPTETHIGLQEHAGEGEVPVAEMETSELFLSNFRHLLPHEIWGKDSAVPFYNNNLFQLIAVLLIVPIFLLVLKSFSSTATGGFVRVFRGWCTYRSSRHCKDGPLCPP